MNKVILKESSKTKRTEEENNSQERNFASFPSGPVGSILALQRSAGNQAVGGLLQSGTREGRSAFGIYEEGHSPEKIQLKPLPSANASLADAKGLPSSVRYFLSSDRGRPLDPATRTFMESRFGYDFAQVRIHDNAQATESACAINSSAYTLGHDIVFGPSRHAPTTVEGRELLAHELTHTIEQRPDGLTQPSLAPSATGERVTAATAQNALAGGAVSAPNHTGVGIARQALRPEPRELSDNQLVREIDVLNTKLLETESYSDRAEDEEYFDRLMAELANRPHVGGSSQLAATAETNKETNRVQTNRGRGHRGRGQTPMTPFSDNTGLGKPRSLGRSLNPARFEIADLRNEVERIERWAATHPDANGTDVGHLLTELELWRGELQRKEALDKKWARYMKYLDDTWTREDDTRRRMRAVPQWSRFMSHAEFEEQLERNPGFRLGTYARYKKFYTTEPKSFNINTRHMGQAAGRPISAATYEDYIKQKNTAEMNQMGDELFLGPIRDTLMAGGALGRVVQIGFALSESYHSGVGLVETVTGETSGADLPSLISGRPDVGRKLSPGERVVRGFQAGLEVVNAGLSMRTPRSIDPPSVSTDPKVKPPPTAVVAKKSPAADVTPDKPIAREKGSDPSLSPRGKGQTPIATRPKVHQRVSPEKAASNLKSQYPGKLESKGKALEDIFRRTNPETNPYGAIERRSAVAELSTLDRYLKHGAPDGRKVKKLTVLPSEKGGRSPDFYIEFTDGSGYRIEATAITSAPAGRVAQTPKVITKTTKTGQKKKVKVKGELHKKTLEKGTPTQENLKAALRRKGKPKWKPKHKPKDVIQLEAPLEGIPEGGVMVVEIPRGKLTRAQIVESVQEVSPELQPGVLGIEVVIPSPTGKKVIAFRRDKSNSFVLVE